MKQIKKRHFMVFMSLVLVCVMSLATVLAYFTDRTEANGTIKTVDNAADIDITRPDPDPTDPTEPDPSIPDDPTDPKFPTDPDDPDEPWEDPTPGNDHDDLANWWGALNATALANFNPGDKLALDAKINNSGTLDLDYRQTFIITSTVAMDKTNPQFRLFTSCKRESYGALTGITVAEGETISSDGKTITYRISPDFLAAGDNLHTNYDLVFDKLSSNAFQNAKVTVQYLVEARQANAAGAAADWTVVETADFTFGGYKTVPQAIK